MCGKEKTKAQLIQELAELRMHIAEQEETIKKYSTASKQFSLLQVENSSIFENSPLTMFLVDRDTRVCKLNKAAEMVMRRKAIEAIGLRGGEALRCVNSLDDPKGCGYGNVCKKCIVRNTVLDTFRTGIAHSSVEAPMPYDSVTGTANLWMLVSTTLLKLPQGERVLVCLEDITELKKIERQLFYARKMESIGTLAGGIAHEFNNILTIIMGNNELIMGEFPQGSLASESSEEIRVAGIRAREVVKQLLTFSRQDNPVKKVMDFNFVVQESMKLIRSSIPANIKIEQNISADTYPVVCNDTQISQLLINLCNNAAAALPEKGGRISIELLNETIDKKQATSQTKLPPGQYAKLMVVDNGIGMEGEILDRVFEPYFTTKDIGEGTGIGMAVVHGIVERHGGAITVDSKPGQGTTFTIFLPIHEGLLEQKTEELDILPIGDEHILYVDDEPSIAKLGKLLLESLGYTTESTTEPEKALDMMRSDPNRFDLLITDMAMPNMTGDQLVIETLKIRQDMPTMICTGYSAFLSEEDATKIGVHSYLMKPINRSKLAKMVRKVLDGAKRSKLAKP